jgi:adenosine deaminase CECR1
MFRAVWLILLARCCLEGLIGNIAYAEEESLYLEKRKALVLENALLGFDHEISLTEKEERASRKLEEYKERVLKHVSFAESFLARKEPLESTELYSFLKKMPKGGLLHVHSSSFLHTKWLIKNIATLPDCYVYLGGDGAFLKGSFHFFEKGKAPHGFFSIAKLLEDLPNGEEFLVSLLQPRFQSLSTDSLWVELEAWFTKIWGLVHHKPAFKKYYYDTMMELIEDGIDYMEFRLLDSVLYHLDGTEEGAESMVKMLLEVKEEVQKQHPMFDFNVIFTQFRGMSEAMAFQQLEKAYFLRSCYPDFIIGYDLVGEEDLGKSTLDSAKTFLQAGKLAKKYQIDLPYYLHDGESNDPSNQNLYDAILLGSKRIGHGLNLFRFPVLIRKMKEEKICLEICPISNQVLGYVKDLRIHPSLGYLKQGVPSVLSSDDPGLFDYHGMTPDFVEAVMAWDLSLKALKQLCFNSIVYSGLSKEKKEKALKHWQMRWNAFIDEYQK